jgi:hypothetical protein
MVKQLPTVAAFGACTPLQVHPAPDADYWGEGESNVHVVAVTSAEAVVWQANASATLISIETTADIRVLANGAATVATDGLPIPAGKDRSFGIPAGASIAIQAVGDDATVSILEA